MTKTAIVPMAGTPSDGLASFTAALRRNYNFALKKGSRKDAIAFAVSMATGKHDLSGQRLPKPSSGSGAYMDRVSEEQAQSATAAADVWENAHPSTFPTVGGADKPESKLSPPAQVLYTEQKRCDQSSQKILRFQDQVLTAYQDKQARELRATVLDLFQNQFIRFDRNSRPMNYPELSGDDGAMLGCEHYARNCKLLADCCDIYVNCRLCHDEAVGEDHTMNRYQTKRVLCTLCLTEQAISPQCTACDVKFAFYYCTVCKFFENTPGREVYHCHHCGICRRGKGLGIDNFHCENCDACVTMASKPHHKCLQKGTHASCPVCCEHLFTSTRPIVYMRCGHSMHGHCYTEYTKTNYACPLCAKSVTDMRNYFSRIDDHLAQETIPPEHAGKLSYILCNDCEQKSTVPFHFLFHKCGAGCNSYNTRVLKSVDPGDSPAVAHVSHQVEMSTEFQS